MIFFDGVFMALKLFADMSFLSIFLVTGLAIALIIVTLFKFVR